MDMWTAIVAIVFVGVVAEVVKNNHKQKYKAANKPEPQNDAKLKELEHRIESLETIILDLEKENRFRNL